MRISPINNLQCNNNEFVTPKFKANFDDCRGHDTRPLVDIAEICAVGWLLTDDIRVEFKDLRAKKEKWYQKIPKVFFTIGVVCLTIDLCTRISNSFNSDNDMR